MDKKFYKCNICGNVATKLTDSGVKMVCCSETMTELVPNSDDTAALEKHVPVVHQTGMVVEVKVGSVDHPMIPEHFIQWIYLVTNKNSYFRRLTPGEAPVAKFSLSVDERTIKAYEYCNLHGLWVAES